MISAILAIVISQTAPPCPDWLTGAECIICQDLYLTMDIPYEDCPCNGASQQNAGSGGAPFGGTGSGDIEGACCLNGICIEVQCVAICDSMGGAFTGSMTCEQIFCPTTLGACCLQDCTSMNSCILDISEQYCYEAGGAWSADCDECNTFDAESSASGVCCYQASNDGSSSPVMDVFCVVAYNSALGCPNQPSCEAVNGTYYPLAEDQSCMDLLQTIECEIEDDSICEETMDTFACCINLNCLELTSEQCEFDGGDWNYGFSCSNFECVDPNAEGACCVEEQCIDQTANQCIDDGGTWYGQYSLCSATDCDEDPDEEPNGAGACCIGASSCVPATADLCASYMGSIFYGVGTTCNDEICNYDPPTDPYGSCCINTNCHTLLFEECEIFSGQWLGQYVSCDGNPCDGGGTFEFGACCSSDDTCYLVQQYICLENGHTWFGDSSCTSMTCNSVSSKLCECILLQGILDNNRLILEELLDQGYTLTESLAVQRLIEENTRNNTGLLTLQYTLLNLLVSEQIPQVITLLENFFEEADPLDSDDYLVFDGSTIFNETTTLITTNHVLIESVIAPEDQNYMGLADYDFDSPNSAPVFTISADQFFPSLPNSSNSLAGIDYEFDFQLLEDWGVRSVVRAIVLILCGWYVIQSINVETRKH